MVLLSTLDKQKLERQSTEFHICPVIKRAETRQPKKARTQEARRGNEYKGHSDVIRKLYESNIVI